MTPNLENDPVSLVIRRRIRPGKEAEYEALLSEAIAMLARMPGHRGTGIVRPAAGDADRHRHRGGHLGRAAR